MIRDSPADWMMRHLVGEVMPELEHLRAGAALWRPKHQPQILSDLTAQQQRNAELNGEVDAHSTCAGMLIRA
jgi:hypothetical protein